MLNIPTETLLAFSIFCALVTCLMCAWITCSLVDLANSLRERIAVMESISDKTKGAPDSATVSSRRLTPC